MALAPVSHVESFSIDADMADWLQRFYRLGAHRFLSLQLLHLLIAAPVAWAQAPSAGGASAASAAEAASAAAAAAALARAAQRNAAIAAALDPRDALHLSRQFTDEVSRRLTVPNNDQRAYGNRLQAALAARGLGALARQYVVLVDRAPNVQALFIYFRASPSEAWRMIGASPVATGLPGRYEHFVTPIGVFEHTPQNMDFRAEGTTNENGIRGYGARDMRIFDFGWTDGQRGWGKGGTSPMRLQMHATDPDKLEPILGIRHSKGCVRIPASLDAFLDRHGVLDADYAALADAGNVVRVLRPERETTPWAGRYMVVVDSGSATRPVWSPRPGADVRAKMPAAADTAD
ncbi:hypothetical protein LJR230_004347 [Trinickia sp. LjRoot230]|uniref:hypothetical protein n=1 Tax=Trinickia sp. LjRoot230 TaxID=3342288 RepID=UPI003ED0FC46